jgi:LytS/YehU family sensor histidine kinase
VDLEKLRHGERLVVESDIALLNDGLPVAPLLLLPFAENCFKHGGPGSDGLFRINIELRSDAQKLAFRIANSKRQKKTETPPGGVGLENIRQRLTLLYPNRHRLEITDGAERYEVHLTVNYER